MWNYSYSGNVEVFIVPVGVNHILVEVAGAEGGSVDIAGNRGSGGRGALVQAYFQVTPGEVLNLYVGGRTRY